MTRRTGNEGLHTRVVQDKRDAEILRQVAADIRAARGATSKDDPDEWYAAEVARMRERAPA